MTGVNEQAAAQAALVKRIVALERAASRIPAGGAWTNVTFENSWANLTGFPDIQPAQYRKVGDMVHVRGKITGGTLGSSAFTLPAEFRPSYQFTNPGTLWNGSAQPSTIWVGGLGDGRVIVYAASNADIGFNFQFATN